MILIQSNEFFPGTYSQKKKVLWLFPAQLLEFTWWWSERFFNVHCAMCDVPKSQKERLDKLLMRHFSDGLLPDFGFLTCTCTLYMHKSLWKAWKCVASVTQVCPKLQRGPVFKKVVSLSILTATTSFLGILPLSHWLQHALNSISSGKCHVNHFVSCSLATKIFCK